MDARKRKQSCSKIVCPLRRKEKDTGQKTALCGKDGFLNGDLGVIRTRGPQLRRLLLYPAELRDQSPSFLHEKHLFVNRKCKKRPFETLTRNADFIPNNGQTFLRNRTNFLRTFGQNVKDRIRMRF